MQGTSTLVKLLCLALGTSVIASPSTYPTNGTQPECVVVQWVIHKILHLPFATPFCSIYLQIPTITKTIPVNFTVPTHTLSTYELKPETITSFPPDIATIARDDLSKACECLSIPTPTITFTATYPSIPITTSSVAANTTTSSSTTSTLIVSSFTTSNSTTSTPISTNGTSTSTAAASTSTTEPETSSRCTTPPSSVPAPFLSSVLSVTTPCSTVVPSPFFPANSTFSTYSHHKPTFTPSTTGYP
ncbi:hypothetical protein F4806DRAFT_492663 [Annulohypoxylon nitens]|nr:hypothetical protein F4806DRAFT_492663 [Annulohypoxylon nitens]